MASVKPNRATRARRTNPERAFQRKLVTDLAKLLPHDCLMTAFPAGGGGLRRGRILKGMGLVAGMPDLLFIYRGQVFGMELKAARGRLEPSQIETHERLAVSGVEVRVVKTTDEAIQCLKDWLIPIRIVGEWTFRKKAAA